MWALLLYKLLHLTFKKAFWQKSLKANLPLCEPPSLFKDLLLIPWPDGNIWRGLDPVCHHTLDKRQVKKQQNEMLTSKQGHYILSSETTYFSCETSFQFPLFYSGTSRTTGSPRRERADRRRSAWTKGELAFMLFKSDLFRVKNSQGNSFNPFDPV